MKRAISAALATFALQESALFASTGFLWATRRLDRLTERSQIASGTPSGFLPLAVELARVSDHAPSTSSFLTSDYLHEFDAPVSPMASVAVSYMAKGISYMAHRVSVGRRRFQIGNARFISDAWVSPQDNRRGAPAVGRRGGAEGPAPRQAPLALAAAGRR